MSIIYLIPIILAIVWCIEYDRQEEFDELKGHRFWLLYVILSLITGLSYALGGDKQTYLSEFNEYSADISDVFTEIEVGITDRGQMPGWVLVNVFAKVFCDSFYVVQLIEAFFINFAIFYTAKRYTKRVFFFVLLYCLSFQYFNYNTEVMREAFSVGFCLLGAEMLFRKRYVLTAVLFGTALLFHVSAIAMLLLFPLMRFHVTPLRFPFALLASLLFWFLSNHLFSLIIEMVLGQQGSLFEKVLNYSTFSTSFVAFIIYSFIYTVTPYFIMRTGIANGEQDEETLRRKEQFLTYFLCISIIVPSFLPLSRFFNYTTPVLLCLTTDTLYTLFYEKRYFFVKIFSVFLFWGYSMFQFLVYIPKIDSTCLSFWLPYTSIIDDESYDRTYRDKNHDMLLDGEKADENTREAE